MLYCRWLSALSPWRCCEDTCDAVKTALFRVFFFPTVLQMAPDEEVEDCVLMMMQGSVVEMTDDAVGRCWSRQLYRMSPDADFPVSSLRYADDDAEP